MKKQIRIGILTFHYAHNYGAVLQAYALKEYLKKTHTDAVLVNYRNKVIESCYSKNRIKETFFNFWLIKHSIIKLFILIRK